jgi:hypothetical protein
MNDWVLPWARSMAREKMIRSRSRIQQVRTGSSGSGWPRPADSAALAAQGASVRASAASSSARTVPRCTQSTGGLALSLPDPPSWVTITVRSPGSSDAVRPFPGNADRCL